MKTKFASDCELVYNKLIANGFNMRPLVPVVDSDNPLLKLLFGKKTQKKEGVTYNIELNGSWNSGISTHVRFENNEVKVASRFRDISFKNDNSTKLCDDICTIIISEFTKLNYNVSLTSFATD